MVYPWNGQSLATASWFVHASFEQSYFIPLISGIQSPAPCRFYVGISMLIQTHTFEHSILPSYWPRGRPHINISTNSSKVIKIDAFAETLATWIVKITHAMEAFVSEKG